MGKLLVFYRAVVGREYDDDSFDDRIEVQKLVYLGSAMGLNLGSYMFVKRERGPYSPALRMDVLDELSNKRTSTESLSEEAQQVAGDIPKLINFQLSGAQELEKYEIVASMHYLKQNDCRYFDKDVIFEKLREWKSVYKKYDACFNDVWQKMSLLIY